MTPPDEARAIEAAVLVPIVLRRAGPTVLLTQRAASLRNHSAQIAFPGGRIDETDMGVVSGDLAQIDPGETVVLFYEAALDGDELPARRMARLDFGAGDFAEEGEAERDEQDGD